MLRPTLFLILCVLACATPARAQRYLAQATSPDHARALGSREASERYSRRMGPVQTGVGFVSAALLGPLGFGGNYFLQVQGTKRLHFAGDTSLEGRLSGPQREVYRAYLAGFNDTARRNRLSRARKSALVGGLAGLTVFVVGATIASAGSD